MIAVCVVCGNVFVGRNIKSKCCSNECTITHNRKLCLENYHKQTIINETRTCTKCGKTFIAKTIGRKTCSDECSQLNNYSYSYKTKKCAICGTIFGKRINGRNHNAKTCSDKCARLLALNISKQKYATYEKKCVICGQDFETRRKRTLTCGDKCHKINRKNYIRKYERKKGTPAYYKRLEHNRIRRKYNLEYRERERARVIKNAMTPEGKKWCKEYRGKRKLDRLQSESIKIMFSI